jgi:hypothetical protein
MNRTLANRLAKLEGRGKRGLAELTDAELDERIRRIEDELGGPDAAFVALVEEVGEQRAAQFNAGRDTGLRP